jgi:DsbC/DsbD-like thiol-disulfide interchange protein
MKKLFIILGLMSLIHLSASSQILKPVTWAYAAKKTGPNTATIFIKASIDQGWHLYSQFVKDGGPVKTSFNFSTAKGYVLIGKTIEPKPITKYESTFSMNVSYFENSVVFQQKIKLNAKSSIVKGKVEFMVCDDKQCLPPEEVEFSVAVKI